MNKNLIVNRKEVVYTIKYIYALIDDPVHLYLRSPESTLDLTIMNIKAQTESSSPNICPCSLYIAQS